MNTSWKILWCFTLFQILMAIGGNWQLVAIASEENVVYHDDFERAREVQMHENFMLSEEI